MCGIVGYVGASARAQRERVAAGCDRMIRRGPDDGGIWCDDLAALGARRLAIMDTSYAGHQPFVSDDGRRALVFNGEIYNAAALRKELEASARFHSASDTEVVLRAYEQWGWAETLERIEGMFGLALWDGGQRRLHAARDRMGEKPFFYRHRDRTLGFASSIEALLAVVGERPEVDPRALDAYLVFQAVPTPMTIYRGLRQLGAAHALTFLPDTDELRVERYWMPRFSRKIRARREEVLEETTRLVVEAVRSRLPSDVTLGTLLSGGVDSSLVTALVRREREGRLHGCVLGLEDPAVDERPKARAIASFLGVELTEAVLLPRHLQELPAMVAYAGQPLADPAVAPTWHLARAARQRMTVALTGDGGDEIFGGYARPVLARWARVWRAALPRPVRTALDAALGGYTRGRLRKLALLAHDGARSAAEAFVYERAFRNWRSHAYGPGLDERADDIDAHMREAWARPESADDHDRVLYGDQATYLPDQVLARVDSHTMAWSLETRAPLLYRPLMEFVASIPGHQLSGLFHNKALFRDVASQFVPRAMVSGRKRGFTMPMARWLRGPLKPHLHAALRHPSFADRGWIQPRFLERMLDEDTRGVADWSDPLWTLFVLAVWVRTSLDRSLPSEAPLDLVLEDVRAARTPTVQVAKGWHPSDPGGLNRVFHEFTRRLPDEGIDVKGLVVANTDVSSESGGKIHVFAAPGDSMVTRVVRAWRAAQHLASAAPGALLVSHFAPYGMSLLPLRAGRRFVVHFQGPWSAESAVEGASAFSVLVRKQLEGLVYRRADVCVVLSRAFADVLSRDFGVPSERIRVIPGGVDLSRFADLPSRDEARRAVGWPPGAPIVLAVRRLARRMGLDRLVDAAVTLRQRRPDVLIYIAGEGRERRRLEDRIAAAGVGGTVRLLGRLPEEILPLAYRAADLTIVPSIALEGFGLVVPESLAAGTPVLVTPVAGLPETVKDLSAAMILANDAPETLARALAETFAGARRLPDAAACKAFARAHYDWEAITRRVADLYQSVA